MANLIITIDGPAASGKSTIARLLAEELGADFLDTGAMYRAVTLAALGADIDMSDEEELLNVLNSSEFGFTCEKGKMKASLDGVDVTEQIRRTDVTANAHYVASAARLREKLVKMQRDFAAGREKIVTEGRDQGTVAFPNADIKVFLTADATERAKRRQAELKAKEGEQKVQNVLKAIEKRDESDRSRDVGPLKPAPDAIVVDTTELTIENVLEEILALVRDRGL